MSESQNYESGFTLEKLKALESALADGVRRVKYTDKEVEYRSLDEMKDLIAAMKKALGLTPCVGGKNKGLFGGRRVVARHSKGLDE